MLRKVAILLDPTSGGGGGTATAPAPAPAPAAQPSAAPKAEPAPKSSADEFGSMDEKIVGRRVKPPEKKAPEPKTEPEEGSEFEKPSTEPAAKPKGEPKALREQLDKLNSDLKAKEKAIADYEAKIKEFDSKGKDSTALAERLAAKEKELAEMQSEVYAIRHEKSPEFIEKWDKPFKQAADYARTQIEQLVITNPEDGAMRQASWDDFASLYNLPANKAIASAKELFGDAAQTVINHLTELRRMDYQKGQALKEAREKSGERSKAEEARRAGEQQAFEASWIKVNNDIKGKRPEWYGEDPEDKDGNELLTEGYKQADAEPLTLQDRLVKEAHMRNRAAAFPRMAHRYERAKERIAELEAQVSELQGSGPGKTRRSGGENTTKEPVSWKDELNQAMNS